MLRRRFLQLAAAGSLLSGFRRVWARPGRTRRVRPGDTSWPSEASWQKLRDEVGGRLLQVQAPAAPLENPYAIGDHPGATQSRGWFGAWTSAPSAYAIAARSTADVVAGVNFAREHNLRLVVKGGGHSYQGTSNAAGSLLIWTRAMDAIALHDAFVPDGCEQEPVPAVSVGAGAMWFHTYDAVTTRGGRYVQGGGCATVGVAGLVLGGGFGSFSKAFGTAAGSLMEAEVVTADGKVRIANRCTVPDLFWALKGGGGGSFGVVTRLTLRTHELPATIGVVFTTLKAASDAAFRSLIETFVAFYGDSLLNPHWGETVSFEGNKLIVRMLFQGLDEAKAKQLWQPFLDAVARAGITVDSPPMIVSMPARNHWNPSFLKANLSGFVRSDDRPGAPANNVWWANNQEEVAIFWHGYESTWMPDSLVRKDQRGRLSAALFAASRHWRVSLHFNKGLAGAPAKALAAARDTATNPAVLSAFALAIIAGGDRGATDEVVARREAAAIHRAMSELRKVVPDPGSYVSESNFFERRWQRAFWGASYPRLRAVKAKYDPTGLFFVHHGVGSEGWSADGFTGPGK